MVNGDGGVGVQSDAADESCLIRRGGRIRRIKGLNGCMDVWVYECMNYD